MVKIMENPIKMDDLGGKPILFGNPHMVLPPYFFSTKKKAYLAEWDERNFRGKKQNMQRSKMKSPLPCCAVFQEHVFFSFLTIISP